jgi:hypothetical protein
MGDGYAGEYYTRSSYVSSGADRMAIRSVGRFYLFEMCGYGI